MSSPARAPRAKRTGANRLLNPESNFVQGFFLPEDVTLPEHLQLEGGLLGSILNNPALFHSIDISAEEFVRDSHRTIFRAMCELANEGQPISVAAVTTIMKRSTNDSVDLEYPAALAHDSNPRAPASIIQFAVDAIRKCAQRRRLYFAMNDAALAVVNENTPVDEAVGQFETEAFDILGGNAAQKILPVCDVVQSVWDTLEEERARDTRLVGRPSGVVELDESTSGFRDGEVTIIGGWPGSGKSAFASQIVRENVINLTPCAYFSFEMEKKELALRLVAQETLIDYMKLRQPKWLRDDQRDRVAECLSDMKKWPLYIDDTPSPELNQLIARSRMMVAKGVKLIVYDYIQKITVRDEKDPRLATNKVSEALRAFAKAHKVPIIVLSQLRRASDTAVVKEPTLQHLKESGNLEQDAHVVLLLHRPTDSDDEYTGADKIKIAKQRSGPKGHLTVRFSGSTLLYRYEDRKEQPKTVEKKKSKKKVSDAQQALPTAQSETGEQQHEDAQSTD